MLFKLSIFVSLAVASALAGYHYPCKLNDYKCMTKYLSSNSACEPRVWGSIPRVVSLSNTVLEVPYANVTFTDQTTTIRNLDKCYVSAFFVNETTKVVILAVDCPNLHLVLIRQLTQRYRYGQDKYFRGRIETQLPRISLTANLQNTNNINFCDQFVYTYLDGVPDYKVYPFNPASAAYIRGSAGGMVTEHLSATDREQFLNLGPIFFRLFVQNLLCDFNCNLDG